MKNLINKIAVDLSDNSESIVVEATSNSVRLFIRAKQTNIDKDSGKSLGIDCHQWFTEQEFYKKFKLK